MTTSAATAQGHYVKMVHNGIEYGLMQAYAEGFEAMHKSEYKLDLPNIANLWGHSSVVQSWLLMLTAKYPTDVHACADQEEHPLPVRQSGPSGDGLGGPTGGPAWMVTEFGASSDRNSWRPSPPHSRPPGQLDLRAWKHSATRQGAPTSRSSWPTVVSARPPTS